MIRLAEAGLTSMRVSLNSARDELYERYYRPSGYSFDDVRERIFESGMDGYLGKPVEPGKLACAVRAAKEGSTPCM